MRARYVSELEGVRQNLIAMGETTLDLLAEALRAVVDLNPDGSARARELESLTDRQHRTIHDQCLNLITLQAPVARDARLITGVLDAIVDLELIGDYAHEIVGLASSRQGRPPSQILNQMADVGNKIRELHATAIQSWRDADRSLALSARPRETALRAECRALSEKVAQLTSAPGDVTAYVNLLLICRHLERILRHAVCVAEQAAEASAPAAA
ncbi:MAG TPA: phosphate uptake regulator PhoU [Bryobacteraceae bacterium]|nr:phosphate uptake regulator PhoU [Bryobacteraceae bacterium]